MCYTIGPYCPCFLRVMTEFRESFVAIFKRTNEIYVLVQLLSHVRLQPHGVQHARFPCPSPTPKACSNSCPSSRWCHPTSHPLLSPSPPAFSLSQHQGLFQYIYTHRYTQHSTHVHTHNLYSVLSLYNYQRVKTTFFPWWVSWSIKWLKSQMKGAAKCKLPQTGLYVKSVQSVCITHSRVGVGLRGSHFWLMQFCRVDGMLSYTEGLNLNVSCIQ